MIRALFFASHNLLLIIAGIAGLLSLVTIHEFGHFFMCKLFNVKTPSFSIGFGPTIFSKKIGETDFKLAAIPLGGYVEIAGNAEIGQGEQKEAYRTDECSLAAKPFYQKFLIMIGGILFNLLFAYIVAILIFAFGAPKTKILYPFNAKPIIAEVSPGSPAEAAGLQSGDRIIAIDEQKIGEDTLALVREISTRPNETINLTIERDGTPQSITVTLGEREIKILNRTVGELNVDFAWDTTRYAFSSAIIKGVQLINYYIRATFKFMGHMFSSRDMSGVAGPVGIISESAKNAGEGLKAFFIFLAILSINLAILNLLPLPIFDGGQILMFGIEALAGRSLPEKVRWGINLFSWALILALFVYITFKDIIRLIVTTLSGSK